MIRTHLNQERHIDKRRSGSQESNVALQKDVLARYISLFQEVYGSMPDLG